MISKWIKNILLKSQGKRDIVIGMILSILFAFLASPKTGIISILMFIYPVYLLVKNEEIKRRVVVPVFIMTYLASLGLIGYFGLYPMYRDGFESIFYNIIFWIGTVGLVLFPFISLRGIWNFNKTHIKPTTSQDIKQQLLEDEKKEIARNEKHAAKVFSTFKTKTEEYFRVREGEEEISKKVIDYYKVSLSTIDKAVEENELDSLDEKLVFIKESKDIDFTGFNEMRKDLDRLEKKINGEVKSMKSEYLNDDYEEYTRILDIYESERLIRENYISDIDKYHENLLRSTELYRDIMAKETELLNEVDSKEDESKVLEIEE